MTFQKTQVESYMNSTNAGVALVTALIAQGAVDAAVAEALTAVRVIRDELFGDIAKVIETDNAMLQAEAAKAPVNTGGGSSTARASSAGGGGTPGGKVFTKEEGLALVLNFGKFKGETIGAILEMPASKAAEYGYETGPGRTWVEWLSQDSEPKRDFAKRAAVAALA